MVYENLSDRELPNIIIRERKVENIISNLFDEFQSLTKILANTEIVENVHRFV
jgi:hypothetical protein